MKYNQFMGNRWPAIYHNRFFTGLLLVTALVMASLVASASGNLTTGDVRDTTGQGDEVFRSADKMPVFPGGEAALMMYLRDNISYPSIAEEKNIQGRVIVQFVVDTPGQVGEVKVVRSVDKELDKEAVRVVKSLPKFTPGRQNGQVVSVWYTLPVTFKH